MKILVSVNAAWNVWNFRRPIVEALLADGHEVIVLAPSDDSVPKLQALGCNFRHLEMCVKGLNPLKDSLLLLRMAKAFRETGPDVVLSFTIKNNVFGALAAKFTGLPFVPNVTGLGTAFLSGGHLERLAVALYKVAFRKVPIVFFQNEDDRNLFFKRGLATQAQARLLPGSGIDLEFFAASPYPTEIASTNFLLVARLLRDKGVLEYVEAARLVKSNHPEARFQILGSTDAQNRTAIDRETVRRWEKEGVIEYLGAVDDVRPVIASAHCIVLPSYREGAPRTLIEAASMARPLIATDVPGCNAVVEHNKTGFLCELRSGASLAAACEKFLALRPGMRAEMGKAGRDKMERHFDQAIVVEAYRTAIQHIGPAARTSA